MRSPGILRRSVWIAVSLVLAVEASGKAGERGPLTIGLLAPLTGTFAGRGKELAAGFELYLDEVGRGVAGRKIELLVEDTEGVPAVALTKTRKLVEKDGVHVLAGGLLAPTGYALAPYVDAQRVPTVFPLIAADDLTQRKPARWVIRTGWTSSQAAHPLGEYAAKVLGYKRIAAIAQDIASGWEMLGGFHKAFEDNGGRVVQKIWTPLNTSDFGPYLAQLRRDVEAVFTHQGGVLGLRFVKQYREFGLRDRLPLLALGVLTTEESLPPMGDDALGIITALPYSEALEITPNKHFKEAYERRTGRRANYIAAFAYTGARWIVEAAKALGGAVEERERFLAALRAVEVADDPRGPLKIDPDGNPIMNVYIRKVERAGGRLQNTVISTYPHVSQYWTYKREDFLKQPVYDRNFPPCRYC